MRSGEILKLTWDKVDLENRIIALTEKDTKEKRAKRIPISKALRFELMQLEGRGTNQYVFTYAGHRVKDISDGLKRACAKCKIKYGREVKGGFIFHDLRHSFITNCRRAEIDRNVRYAITGHSNSRDMNTRYDVVNDQDLLNAIDQYEVYLQKFSESFRSDSEARLSIQNHR